MAECVYVYDSLGRALEEAQTLEVEGSPVTRFATNHAYFSAVIAGVTYPNGRQIENTYDALYRRVQVADTHAPGSSSSSSSDSSESSGESSGVIAQWDFFGDRIAETRLGNGITCTFMNNSRTHSAVQSPGTALPGWGDASSDRLGYDGAGRMIAKRYIPSAISGGGGYVDTTPVVGFTTRFDKASNKFYERALHAENRSFLYIPADAQGQPLEGTLPGIDSMNRLLQYQRGNLAAGGGSVVTPLTLPGADASRTYDLDHLGNWKKSAYAAIPEPPESSSSSDSSFSSEDLPVQHIDLRNHNALNQITRRKVTSGGTSGAGGWDIFAYDLNGNLLDDGQRLMAYDSLNRLVQVARKSDGAVIGRYLYDAGNRRVQKVVTNGGLSEDIPNGTSQYTYFAGTWQDTEEFHAPAESLDPSQPYKQFIWGTYIDELTQLTLLQATGPQELPPGAYYPLQDLLFRTAGVTDAAIHEASSSSSGDAPIGQIVEAYDYDAYGNTLIFTQPGTGESWWANDVQQANFAANDVLWCGYRYEASTVLSTVRHRSYVSRIARWLQRDPINYENGMNIYQYTESMPIGFRDPYGLTTLSAGAYWGFGATVDINFLDRYQDCCTSGGKFIKNGYRKIEIGVLTHAGIGVGGKFKVKGVGVDLTYKMFGIQFGGSLKLDSPSCGQPLQRGCSSSIVSLNVDNSLTTTLMVFSLTVEAAAKGGLELETCYEPSSGKGKISLYFNGTIDIGASISFLGNVIKEAYVPNVPRNKRELLWHMDF